MKTEYYDGTTLLNKKDIDGNKPELFLCTSNRTAGKTTYFNRMLVNRWLNKKEKFLLLYRYNYEMTDCANAFFKDIGSLFFPGHEMECQCQAKGMYYTLTMDKKECGYAVAINGADKVKKRSHVFTDVSSILFDEFQSETNSYCPDEVRKFLSIHKSVARGQNQQRRYVPVYMVGNPVSILNPYYVELGITNRLRANTHFLRGTGWVLEQGFNKSASLAQLEGGIDKAFSTNEYIGYSASSTYLNDKLAFIDKPLGKGRYICTIKCDTREYGVREYQDDGIIYVDDRPDKTHPMRLAVTLDDHAINYVLLKNNQMFICQMRDLFEKGCFRFKNLQSKDAVLKMLSY